MLSENYNFQQQHCKIGQKIQNSEGNYFQTRTICLNKSPANCKKTFSDNQGLKISLHFRWLIEKAKQSLYSKKNKRLYEKDYVREYLHVHKIQRLIIKLNKTWYTGNTGKRRENEERVLKLKN